ncbi:hypothetical protein [Erythrobacter litoralis]|uniref:Uncharacterized protein n=1 Tax=Erythrobacter litoralis (strain HTCC2594) TaxID=314225 RepID=Q2N5T8_ERYLH|nr:hypothetical protein [Erythrobacter litoralis]ABC64953.1 hypothetical protein ELI_14305 [Erythrobacter litoralis HTCC2594]
MISAGRFLLIAPLLAMSLQGCVAAVIPLAAAGAMGSTIRDKPDTPQIETKVTGSLASASVSGEKAIGSAAGVAPSAAIPRTGDGAGPGSSANGEIVILSGVTALPEPSASALPPGRSSLAPADFVAFADYALELAQRDPLADEVRPSALLAQPGVLTADRAPCRFAPAAVLIDLDPADGPLSIETAAAPRGLGEQLARLRAADVEIVWSSSLTADHAGDLRSWLKNSGLDPAGEDRLLLLRYPEDRKQTRRDEAAKERCLVAMLGDERSDFDELFDYLKDPDAAFGLDEMLGQGWFLAPIPAEGQTQ